MVTLVLVCFQPTQQCLHHQHHPVCVVFFTTRCHTLHMRCTTPLNHLVSVSQTKPFEALALIPFAINPHQPLCFTASHLATSTHTTVFAPSLCFFAQPQVQPLIILQPPQSTHHHDEPQSLQQTPHPFPCSCPLLPNPFLFLFCLCHSTTWWWWCMVMCTHNLCVHSTTPITPKSNTMVPLLCNHPQTKKGKK